jgi:glyoxylase-like metal-dependent hydrolase (beta-lactamase superfamily II)
MRHLVRYQPPLQDRAVDSRRLRAAPLNYLRSSRRLKVLRADEPLWPRHDPGRQTRGAAYTC